MNKRTQAAYERIRAWLTRPGATRAIDGRYCVYETSDGNRCAIGVLLSQEAIAELRFLGRDALSGSVVTARARSHLTRCDLDGIDVMFLKFAQQAHDKPVNWNKDGFNVSALDRVARDLGLVVIDDEPVVVPDYPPVEERQLVGV